MDTFHQEDSLEISFEISFSFLTIFPNFRRSFSSIINGDLLNFPLLYEQNLITLLPLSNFRSWIVGS